jgi:hypothetical protein
MQMTTTDATGQIVRQDFPWSYSHIKNFETCPHRYNQIDLLNAVREPESQELKEGFYVHTQLAKRISNGIPLPPTVPYEHWAKYALEGGGVVKAEQKLAITKEFAPCDYFDKIKKVWLRTVADVLRVDDQDCHIIDWKTGKVKPDPDQLMLIGLCALVHYPKVYNFQGDLVWLGHNTKTTAYFTADDVAKFWVNKMAVKVEELQNARNSDIFPKKPSGLCRMWCPVKSCEHCGQ